MTPDATHVAVEDPAVAGERDHALLDAGAGAVVQADQRRPDRQRQVHHLVDLLGEHLAEGAAEDREVLGEDEDLAAVDRAPAGDHAVGVGPLLDAAGERPVAGQHVELVERARVEQDLDPLAGEQLALGVLALDRPLRAGLQGFFLALGQLLEALVHRVLHRLPNLPVVLFKYRMRAVRDPSPRARYLERRVRSPPEPT